MIFSLCCPIEKCVLDLRKGRILKMNKLKDTESVIVAIMGSLLLTEYVNRNIKQLIDSSKNKSLSNNQIILETYSKKFKITVEEV